MGTINDKLNKLEQTKTDLRNELNSKGAEVGVNDTFASYVGKLHDLEILNAQAKTVNPSTSSQTVIPDSKHNALSQVTVNPVTSSIDNNIVSENIKANTTILGVQGKSSVVDTEDANATDVELAQGKSAYVNGTKINGKLVPIAPKLETTLGFKVDNVYRATDIEYPNIVFGKDTGWDITPYYTTPESEMKLYITKDDLADAIGLRSDIILEGNTILNIVGTVKLAENLADEMRLYDIAKKSLDDMYTIYSDRNYTDDEVAKLEYLLNILGGNING